MIRTFILAIAAFFAFAAPVAAQVPGELNAQHSLHSGRAAVAPGETFTIVLRQVINEDWHTYWRNPGDSGEPTQLTWQSPSGWQVGEIQWPTPEAIPFATLVNFGYEGEVLFPIEVTAPANARPGQTANFTIEVYSLVCAHVCIPETSNITFSMPVAAQGRDDAEWAPRIAAAVAALPRREEGVTARISTGDPARLSVTLPNAQAMRNVRFFPFSPDTLIASNPQNPRGGTAGFSFDITGGADQSVGQAPIQGLVVYEVETGGAWLHRGVEIEAQPGEPLADTDGAAAPMSDDYPLAELEGAVIAPAAAPLDATGLLLAIGLAFLGGLILNIMPCVLPVLSVKALSFAGGAHSSETRTHGLLYFAGVMVTFLALAGLLIALRGAGEAVGWGFQLQAPWVTSALALLFFAIGLNLLGVFEIGGSLQNAGGGLAERGGNAGAFFTGALAVIAATPCTAPFMAGAIGVAITQSPLITLVIFAALAVGFALPLTILHFMPALQRLIPKPGAWMDRAKQVLAFPMFAAAVWLAWVLTEQAGAIGVLSLLLIATALGFLLLAARWGRAWLIVGLIVLFVTGVFTWRPLLGVESQTALVSEPWSETRVAELRAEGRGVFVNFTAAWCVTCKINEGGALSSGRVADAFAQNNVAYLKADWTNQDDTIAAELARYGRAGVPLYLYFPPEGDVVVLPANIVLTDSTIIDTISGAQP